MKNILLVGAHYDDVELGAGGSAAKWVDEGKNVYKITLTDTAVFSKDMGLNITASSAKKNSADAAKILGVIELEFPTVAYGNLAYSQKIMQKMEHIIREKEIDTCIFHFCDDYQTDHLGAHQICKTAARHCSNIMMFQSNPYILTQAFSPTYFVDITKYVDKKRKALSMYDAEHNRQGNLFETNIKRNEVWGYGNHVSYAEGFMIIKMMEAKN